MPIHIEIIILKLSFQTMDRIMLVRMMQAPMMLAGSDTNFLTTTSLYISEHESVQGMS